MVFLPVICLYLLLTPETEYGMIRGETYFPEGLLGRFYEKGIAKKA